MPRIPSLPNVYKRKRKYPNGEIKDSSTYYFKAVVNGKRTDVNTRMSNKRDAETQMRSWFENHTISVEGVFCNAKIPKVAEKIPHPSSGEKYSAG